MKKRIGLASALAVVLVLSSLFAFGGVLANAKQPAADEGGKPLTVLVAGYGWYYGIPPGCVNNAEAVAMALDGEVVKAHDFSGTVIAKGRVHGIAVPVNWWEVMDTVNAGIAEFEPDIVIGLGTHGGINGLQPEPWGSNVMSGADANELHTNRYCGFTKIDPAGADWMRGNLPYWQMTAAMLEAGVPAQLGHQTGYVDCPDCGEVDPDCIDKMECANCPTNFPSGRPSATPGWYMCNFMTYNLAQMIEEEEYDFLDLAGFIHVPQRSAYAALFRCNALEGLTPGSAEYIAELEKTIGKSLEIDRTIDGVRIAIEECLRAKAGF